MALVILYGNLFKNEESEDAIPGSYPKIDVCHTNLSLVLLSLFVPWNYLLSLFMTERVTSKTYKEFCY